MRRPSHNISRNEAAEVAADDRALRVDAPGRFITGLSSVMWPVVVITVLAFAYSDVIAQEQSRPGYHHPLNQYDPPGRIARWAVQVGRASPTHRQPIKVTLPKSGRVTVFSGPNAQPHDINTPAQFGVSPGYVYRLKISHMPQFPGVELYPSIEIVDQLHPPSGKEDEFPIPVALSEMEIRHVLDGRFVTKIIYLEQPQLASHFAANDPDAVAELPNTVNLLTEADRRGRPLVIIRIGGRMPPVNGDRRAFFSPNSPLWLSPKPPPSSSPPAATPAVITPVPANTTPASEPTS